MFVNRQCSEIAAVFIQLRRHASQRRIAALAIALLGCLAANSQQQQHISASVLCSSGSSTCMLASVHLRLLSVNVRVNTAYRQLVPAATAIFSISLNPRQIRSYALCRSSRFLSCSSSFIISQETATCVLSLCPSARSHQRKQSSLVHHQCTCASASALQRLRLSHS